MLALILDQNLIRFSSVVRAVDVWFGLQWSSLTPARIKEALQTVRRFLEDREARAAALRTATGETLFQSVSAANSSGYTNSQNDNLINQTLTSSSLTPLYNWQDYLQTQLPEMWQPNGVYLLEEYASNLHGFTPQSPTLNITPENWYFTK